MITVQSTLKFSKVYLDFLMRAVWIMANIPKYTDPTLQAMYQKIEEKPREKRDYLGASLIGNPCARQIYYQYNGYEQEPFGAETLMNFEDGHRTEDLTAERLRMVDGIKLITGNNTGKQLGFSALSGKFKGHYDGIITGILQAPKARHIWECKASGEKKFREFEKIKETYGEKETLKRWNENYYAQAQLYMHYEQIDRHYLTIAYAGGRKYQSCRTNYDGAVAERYIDRASKIIQATAPPPKMREEKDYYICRWCNFKDTCHG